MSEPTVPAQTPAIENAAEAAMPTSPPEPELPDELLPLHEEFGDWWRICFEPMCHKAPYTARPRFDGGRTVRTDTVRLLGRVLAAATPDEDDEPTPGTAE
ncbi:hypothetical protein F4561_002420 [Lipingzhangella halophila]|uniref:Uncharacterized protein n=1 Tax=Lipingzhangella halophila TaxID=1783352 RepID=A0A7W7RGM3_9ACTN|nr:hypothetical protein [Lipingzhangella halophila]MBB4931600.1 hypothetical protein [Lipingzhangella halophila]